MYTNKEKHSVQWRSSWVYDVSEKILKFVVLLSIKIWRSDEVDIERNLSTAALPVVDIKGVQGVQWTPGNEEKNLKIGFRPFVSD